METNAVGSSAAGASKARIAAVERWREGDEFDSAERAALALADAATSTPAEVSDEVFAEARRHFSEQQLVELAATVALEKLPGLPHPSSLWNPRVLWLADAAVPEMMSPRLRGQRRRRADRGHGPADRTQLR